MISTSNDFPLRCAARAALLAVPFLLLAGAATSRASQVDFVVDSTQSYLSLAIPNFTYATTTVNVTGQNRTNGAPVTGTWSNTTGNKASITGGFSTNLSGNLNALSSIEFIAGSSTLTALNSGNYRPNPAAYNSSTSAYNNNSPAAGAYGATLHVSFGNVALFSMSNVTYDLHTASALAVSSNQFSVNTAGNPLITGISSELFNMQGIGGVLPEPIVGGSSSMITGLAAGDTSTAKGVFAYNMLAGTAQLTIPIIVPFSILVNPGDSNPLYLNGTATGRIVATSVPEPSTLAMAGIGFAALVVAARRRKRAS